MKIVIRRELNKVLKENGKKIIIAGAGYWGRSLIRIIEREGIGQIEELIDNRADEINEVNGYRVNYPHKINHRTIIISVEKYAQKYEIYYQLLSMGVNESDIYAYVNLNTIGYRSNLDAKFYRYEIDEMYYEKTGKYMDWDNPKTFNEKIQWSKIYRTNVLLTEYTDKMRVRNYVRAKIGEEYLIPLVGGPYFNTNEIDFEALPERYVIKTNHGAGFNFIVDNKDQADIDLIKRSLNSWINIDYSMVLLEMHYKDIVPQIIIEKNIRSVGMEDLPDYKFFCFGGKVFCLYVRVNTNEGHDGGRIGFFNRNFELLPYYRKEYKQLDHQIDRPQNFEQMIKIAEILSEGFSHVRVDLYNVEGKVYFGEMTFSTCGGYSNFDPEDFDEILGEQWDLSSGI